MRPRPWLLVAGGPLALTLTLVSSVAPAQAAASHVRPGAVVTLADMHCEVGALLHQGRTVYAAIPGSCGALPLDEGKRQNGCVAAVAPVGVSARIGGARHKATLVYDSFTRMQSVGVTNRAECDFNDLALLQLSPTDARAARPGVIGVRPAQHVTRHRPGAGSTATCGSQPAVMGVTTHHGWVHEMTSAPAATAGDVGMPVQQSRRLIGMFTILPAGTVTRTNALVYDLHRALVELRKTPGFHHVRLLR